MYVTSDLSKSLDASYVGSGSFNCQDFKVGSLLTVVFVGCPDNSWTPIMSGGPSNAQALATTSDQSLVQLDKSQGLQIPRLLVEIV